jgi:carbamoyl-phosphate synthase large subunit
MGRELAALGFKIHSSSGTAKALSDAGVPVNSLLKLSEGRPNVVDLLKNKEIGLVINTPAGPMARADEVKIRTTALYAKVPVMTTIAAAQASVQGIRSQIRNGIGVKALQDYHRIG